MEVIKSRMLVKRAWTDMSKYFCYFEWRINNASSYFQKFDRSNYLDRDIYLKSPEFSTGSPVGDKWRVLLTINDFRFLEDHVHTIEFEGIGNFVIEANFHLRSFIIDDECKHFKCVDRNLYHRERDYFDTAIFFDTKELLENKNKCMPNDTLTIGVELTLFDTSSCSDDSLVMEFRSKIRPIINDFENFYLKTEQDLDVDADIIVKVQDKIFKAHKTILMTRCPDFFAFFPTQKDENEKDCVVIPNMNPDVFNNILQFIYTDGCKYLDHNVEDLFITADKLKLHKLREMCSQSFYKILSCKNATRLLVMANNYNLVDLGDYVSDFIVRNAEQVIQTPEYRAIVESNPSISVILLKKLVALMVAVL